MKTHRRSQTLYRDPNDKMIGGVCSGIAHYFDIDTILVRVGFLVIAILGGGGVLAYAILWAVLNPAPPGAFEAPAEAEIQPGNEVIDLEAKPQQGEPTIETPSHEVDEVEAEQ